MSTYSHVYYEDERNLQTRLKEFRQKLLVRIEDRNAMLLIGIVIYKDLQGLMRALKGVYIQKR